MPQSLAKVWLHIVYSTKDRKTYLKDEAFREEMFRMLAWHVNDCGCVSASVGGHVDHVHLLVGFSRTIEIAKLVEKVKSATSSWAKDTVPEFQWQSGYGVFSVSHSLKDTVDEYIRNQEQHHSELSYQDEYRLLCQKHGIEIDERYVWD